MVVWEWATRTWHCNDWLSRRHILEPLRLRKLLPHFCVPSSEFCLQPTRVVLAPTSRHLSALLALALGALDGPAPPSQPWLLGVPVALRREPSLTASCTQVGCRCLYFSGPSRPHLPEESPASKTSATPHAHPYCLTGPATPSPEVSPGWQCVLLRWRPRTEPVQGTRRWGAVSGLRVDDLPTVCGLWKGVELDSDV